ncbi:hypothetical protein BH10CYA1_BH10CYA1_15920 [soil metagenome]
MKCVFKMPRVLRVRYWGSAVITSNWITSLKITSNTAQIVVSIAIDSQSWRLNSQEDLRAEEAK